MFGGRQNDKSDQQWTSEFQSSNWNQRFFSSSLINTHVNDTLEGSSTETSSKLIPFPSTKSLFFRLITKTTGEFFLSLFSNDFSLIKVNQVNMAAMSQCARLAGKWFFPVRIEFCCRRFICRRPSSTIEHVVHFRWLPSFWEDENQCSFLVHFWTNVRVCSFSWSSSSSSV